jgi:hypothetical protein
VAAIARDSERQRMGGEKLSLSIHNSTHTSLLTCALHFSNQTFQAVLPVYHPLVLSFNLFSLLVSHPASLSGEFSDLILLSDLCTSAVRDSR